MPSPSGVSMEGEVRWWWLCVQPATSRDCSTPRSVYPTCEVQPGQETDVSAVPFEFTDVAEAHRVASLLRRQASAFQLLAGRLTGDQAQDFKDRAREAIAIASRIDAAADARGPAFI
jgi:hypothetical protein